MVKNRPSGEQKKKPIAARRKAIKRTEAKTSAKAARVVSFSRRVQRVSTEVSSSGIAPIEIAIAGPDGEISYDRSILRRISQRTGVPYPMEEAKDGEQRRSVRPHGPIEKSRIKLRRLEREVLPLEKAAFKEAKKYLTDGFSKGFSIIPTCVHFLNQPNLTLAAIERKYDNVLNFQRSDGISRYEVSAAHLANTKMKMGNIPHPAGGDYIFTKSKALFVNEKSHNGIQFNRTADFPYDLPHKSVLFPLHADSTTVYLTEFLTDQLKIQPQGPKIDPPTHITQLIQVIQAIGKETDSINYKPPTSETFFTSDYNTTLCQINGERRFVFESTEYRIEIKRKLIVSEIRSTANWKSSYHIPLLEEATIFVQKLENALYANTESCLVLSSVPVIPNTNASHLHVLGDNAFTLLLPAQLVQLRDRHEASMNNVGAVIKTLDTVECVLGLEDTKRQTIVTNFGFLVNDDQSRIYAKLKEIVQNERQQALADENDEEEKQVIRERHTKDAITPARLLSRSFLVNQLKIGAITSEDEKQRVSQWNASATFTLIVIRIQGRTYGFIQTFRITDGAQIDSKVQVVTEEVNRANAPSQNDGYQPPSSASNTSVKPFRRQGKISLIDPDDEGMQRGSSFPGQFHYRSALPPELELELELLS